MDVEGGGGLEDLQFFLKSDKNLQKNGKMSIFVHKKGYFSL